MVNGTVENHDGSTQVTIEVVNPEGTVLKKEEFPVSSNARFSGNLKIDNPELWYPFTYGSQPLYKITAALSTQDTRSQTLGFRRLRLLQHKLKKEPGTSFTFEINNIRIFAGGSCWIPADFMLPRVSRKRYEDWIILAKSGNQSMIRVWGGGIVESDDFYDICDREGVLIWQDFPFACGNYPASDDFCELVKYEAEQQVQRVGHHPSLVIWVGNNEDYMLAYSRGWEWDPHDEKGPWDHTNFPARRIYERVLPEVCERLAGDVPYWRSSPYGGDTANDVDVGDTHVWDGNPTPPCYSKICFTY